VWEELWKKFVESDPITKIISGAVGFIVLSLAGWLATYCWRKLRPWLVSGWGCCRKLAIARNAVEEGGPGLWLSIQHSPQPPPVVRRLQNLGKLILTIANLKGGVGKTTLAANLAAYFANPFDDADRPTRRVLVIDLDFQGSCSSMLFARTAWRPQPNQLSHASELISGSLNSGNRTLIGQPVTDLRDARGISSFYDVARVENREMVRWLIGDEGEDIRYRLAHLLLSDGTLSHFDVVLIDAPPRLTTSSIQALCASTHVLMPVVADPLSADDPVGYFGRELMAHEELWPHLRILGVVATITDRRQRGEEEPALNGAGDRLKAALEGSKADLRHVLNRGERFQFPYECSMRRSTPLARAASDGIAYTSLGDTVQGRAIRSMFDTVGQEVERRWRL
jgi:cellulose biosynthesis protein BcsQ